MPPLYAYETKEIRRQIGEQNVPVVIAANAIEGKEYYCGCDHCSEDAKVIYKTGKFRIKYGDSKNHSKLCKELNRFLNKSFDESAFNFDKQMQSIVYGTIWYLDDQIKGV